MKKFAFFCCSLLISSLSVLAQEPIPCLNPEHPMRIPATLDGKLLPREIGCWFPRDSEVEKTDGYRAFLDAVGQRTSFDLLAVSSRLVQTDSIQPENVKFHEDAARYALERYGILPLLDAEIRLSRRTFHETYPDKSQWNLRMAETEQPAGEDAVLILNETWLSDHYTHNYKYDVLGTKLIRVWSYEKDADGQVIPSSVQDVTAQAKCFTETGSYGTTQEPPTDGAKPNPGWCKVVLAGKDAPKARFVTVAVAFEFLYPDLHSVEALNFERQIFAAHKDVPAGGCVKDEWGFPPCFEPTMKTDHFWFSDTMAAHYAETTRGRDLVDDLFQLFAPRQNGKDDRVRIADVMNRLNLEQLQHFEQQLYTMTKEQWGPTAMPATHPTWYPYPGTQEFRKNSLPWWRHARDFAQTDETTPFACRSGMSKREGHVWYNEFYNDAINPYQHEEWTCVLGGGKQNIHPFCCSKPELRTPENFATLPILDAGLDEARAKTRLLNLTADVPLYCPVGVVFGHFACMNWERPEFNTVGTALRICDFFAERGYPADLVPSSEASMKTLAGKPCWTLNSDGLLQYGSQAYHALLFYAETDSDRADFEALRKLNKTGKTRIVVVPGNASEEQIAALCQSVLEDTLVKLGTQTPWIHYKSPVGWNNQHTIPEMAGFARRLDGTLLWTNASLEASTGLPIALKNETVKSNDGTLVYIVSAQANGLLACRFDADGRLEMLTAAGLTQFCAGGVDLELKAPVDIALWKDANGQWQGVFQAKENQLPEELRAFPAQWRFLQKP